MTTVPDPVSFPHWLAEFGPTLRPPVNNRQVLPTGEDFIVQIVGGPNERDDFHVDPYEEYFYQVKGNMHLIVMTPHGRRRVDIGEGDMWMLPRGLPHSPQRPEPGSIGIVVERVREPGTTERFEWYCPNCDNLVRSVELQVTDIVADLPPVYADFEADVAGRMCTKCGTEHPARVVTSA